ncbi:hypothetical protein [Streptomyces bobili]|uniref:Uncharacterized protein n=1 Tax=Streptomyces bobili TaxID=67280 RepID=A0ABZ1R9C0_9ACTN|nr:hypothetical protein [Streptomyces bobili]
MHLDVAASVSTFDQLLNILILCSQMSVTTQESLRASHEVLTLLACPRKAAVLDEQGLRGDAQVDKSILWQGAATRHDQAAQDVE